MPSRRGQDDPVLWQQSIRMLGLHRSDQGFLDGSDD